MINYELTERGNFTAQDFNEKIREALNSLSENFKQQELSFNEIRHSLNQAYTIRNEEFCGTYITIRIFDKEKALIDINCFMDNKEKFIEISTSEQYNH